MNENQNSFVLGSGRTTSRVLNPPGGKTSFSLGVVDPEPTSKPTPVPPSPPKKQIAVQVADGEENKEEDDEKKEEEVNQTDVAAPGASGMEQANCQKAEEQPVSANAFASGRNMNGAQVMTGRPTSRVLCPGGGGGPTSWTLG